MKTKKLFILIVIIILLFIGAGAIYNRLGNKLQPASKIANEDKALQKDDKKEKAPDFKVMNQDGKKVSLHDLLGKPIVINFWASKCPPCRKEMPEFNEVYKKYKDKVNFMMVDAIGFLGETKDTGEAFVKENKFSFPIFFDEDLSAQRTYGVTAFPTTYILDKDGNFSKGQSGMLNGDVLAKALDEELAK